MVLKVAVEDRFQFKVVPNFRNFCLLKQSDVHYIGGTDVLPAPLAADEEADAISKLGTQDEKGAKSQLIEHNLRLVVYIAKKFDNTGVGVEDLISIGTIGLIKAVNTFDVSRGNRLSSYAAKCIDNEILMLLRAEKKMSREVSLYEPIGTDKEGNEIHLFDVIESGECDASEHYCKKEDICRLHRGIQTVLLPKEKRVVVLRYGLFGHLVHTQKEVGSVLGISRSYVSRIEKSALEKLRSFLMM